VLISRLATAAQEDWTACRPPKQVIKVAKFTSMYVYGLCFLSTKAGLVFIERVVFCKGW
jgi:hypothetical protein